MTASMASSMKTPRSHLVRVRVRVRGRGRGRGRVGVRVKG